MTQQVRARVRRYVKLGCRETKQEDENAQRHTVRTARLC